MARLRLDFGNALAYAMFFCGFLVGDGGEAFPFVTERGPWSLDTGRTPQNLTPRIEMPNDGSGVFRINAYLAHAGGLCAAVLEVKPDGAIIWSRTNRSAGLSRFNRPHRPERLTAAPVPDRGRPL